MVVGGMTQYLAQVQGMPKGAEKKLEKRIRKFIWGEKTKSPINIDILYAPIKMGGRGLLDIKSRNEAIDLMWLKSYLKFNNDRPLWTLVADALMAINLPQSESSSNRETKQSVFLQSWKTLSGTKCPKTIRKLFLTAKKFAVWLEGLAFTPSITIAMPIWYHAKADPKIRCLTGSEMSKCLMKTHKIMRVGEIEKLANSLQNPTHTPDPNCLCENCVESGDVNECENPHYCYKQAEKLIGLLPPKWNPTMRYQPGGDIIMDNTNDPDHFKREYFSGKYETDGTIADTFHVFTEGETTNDVPQKCNDNRNTEITKVHIATKLITVNDIKKVVAVIYYGRENPKNSMLKISNPPKNWKQELEALIAIKIAVKETSTNVLLHIETDCKKVVKMLTSQLYKLENQNFLLTQYPNQTQALVAELRNKRTPPSYINP